ncbi:ankyrin repeat domain-containing protein [Sphingopyxis sp. KK2]|uniref:ankyrin repeat domain-containing protein n=1 Tax=Sphingopyxis sp. KK2 TaxID=1855727 RepID=UPI00097E576B|nr:ankyrin repeat domain-containing protein [Sphingopyxis sp. KK2]
MGRWQREALTEGQGRDVAAPPPFASRTVPLPIAARQGGLAGYDRLLTLVRRGNRTSMKPLHEAAYNADLNAVKRLLDVGQSVDDHDDAGYTPLLWSCLRGQVGDQIPIVQALLAAGADPDALTAAKDANCLVLAVQSGNVELMSQLIAAGADLNAAADDVTPLMVAARDGNDEAVETMLALGANAALIIGGFTAADYANYGGHDQLAVRLRMDG